MTVDAQVELGRVTVPQEGFGERSGFGFGERFGSCIDITTFLAARSGPQPEIVPVAVTIYAYTDVPLRSRSSPETCLKKLNVNTFYGRGCVVGI